MAAFWTAFVYIFLAELGDKTQLMTMAMSARYPGGTVFGGVVVATALINLISVELGTEAGHLLPIFWINVCAGLAFICFGIWELRPERLEGDEDMKEGRFGPFLTVVFAFFLAELGDKTMLAAIAIAARDPEFLPVWLGSTLGLVACNSLGIVAGKLVKDRLSTKWLRLGIAIVYIASGLAALYQAYLRHGL